MQDTKVSRYGPMYFRPILSKKVGNCCMCSFYSSSYMEC